MSKAAFFTALRTFFTAGDFSAAALILRVARTTRLAALFTIFFAASIAGEAAFSGSASGFFFNEALATILTGTSSAAAAEIFLRDVEVFFAVPAMGLAGDFFFSGFISRGLGKLPTATAPETKSTG